MNARLTVSDVVKMRLWQTPNVTSLGRLPAHVPLYSWREESDAQANRPTPSRQYLDGEWSFELYESPDAVPAAWPLVKIARRPCWYRAIGNCKASISPSIPM